MARTSPSATNKLELYLPRGEASIAICRRGTAVQPTPNLPLHQLPTPPPVKGDFGQHSVDGMPVRRFCKKDLKTWHNFCRHFAGRHCSVMWRAQQEALQATAEEHASIQPPRQDPVGEPRITGERPAKSLHRRRPKEKAAAGPGRGHSTTSQVSKANASPRRLDSAPPDGSYCADDLQHRRESSEHHLGPCGRGRPMEPRAGQDKPNVATYTPHLCHRHASEEADRQGQPPECSQALSGRI